MLHVALKYVIHDADGRPRFAVATAEQGSMKGMTFGYEPGTGPDPTGDGNGFTEMEARAALADYGLSPEQIERAVGHALAGACAHAPLRSEG